MATAEETLGVVHSGDGSGARDKRFIFFNRCGFIVVRYGSCSWLQTLLLAKKVFVAENEIKGTALVS